MKRAARALMAFSLQWQSPAARHNDRWFADRIDFYRDIFPGEMSKRIFAAYFGESYQESFPPGILVPPFSEKHPDENKPSYPPILPAHNAGMHFSPKTFIFYNSIIASFFIRVAGPRAWTVSVT